jgi:signal transduction histidine kinase
MDMKAAEFDMVNASAGRPEQPLRSGTMQRLMSHTDLTADEILGAVNASRQGVLLLNADLKAVFINQAFRQLWQLPDAFADSQPYYQQLLEHGWEKGFYGVDAESMAAYRIRHIAQVRNPNGSGQVRIDLADGRSYLMESVPVPPDMRMLTYTDATSMVATLRAAEAANRSKAYFMAGMGHELRTPLNGILGFVQLLGLGLAGPVNDKQADFVAQIEKSGRHLLELIDDINYFAKLDIGKLTINAEAVSVMDIVDDAEAMVSTLAASRGIHVAWPDAAGEPVAAEVDPLRARQILVNLLSNAIKYNRPFGTVAVEIIDGPSFVKVAVTDEGCGIPLDRQAALFQPFNRLGFEKTAIEGSGIGLAFSRKLAEAMSGRLDFTSTPGTGSCFWVEFPKAVDTASRHSWANVDLSRSVG